MFIQPNTNIYLLTDIPLEPTYNHTLWFNNTNEQYRYFNSKAKYRLTENTYQRVNNGTIRVGIKADNLYDCNYVMFQNASFGNKWFYAFVDAINYINDEVTEIVYTLDRMQTWLTEHTLPNTCYIDRQHTTNDAIGANIQPEGLELGEYVYNNYQALDFRMDKFTNLSYTYYYALEVTALIKTTITSILKQVFDDLYLEEYTTIRDGVPCATVLYMIPADNNGVGFIKLNSIIQELTTKGYSDAITSLYLVPDFMVNANHINRDKNFRYENPREGRYLSSVGVGSRITGSETIDGYTPKNNKLYTYPYNFLCVDNSQGNTLNLCYELFGGGVPTVNLYASVNQPVTALIKPLNYKGQSICQTETLSIASFPQGNVVNDTFYSWLVHQYVPNQLNYTMQVGQTVFGSAPRNIGQAFGQGALQGGLIGGVIGGVSRAGQELNSLADSAEQNIRDSITDGYKNAIAVDTTRGNFNTGNINAVFNESKFYYGRMSVRKEVAKRIDDYFSMFGYKTSELTTPNRNKRPHWNYIKTLNLTVTGSVPQDDMKIIEKIYNKGITFWNNPDEVGHYELDNRMGA